MKKYYMLKKDLPTFRAGDVFALEDNGCLYAVEVKASESGHWKKRVMAYHAKTLAVFPNILDEWFELFEYHPKPLFENKKSVEQLGHGLRQMVTQKTLLI